MKEEKKARPSKKSSAQLAAEMAEKIRSERKNQETLRPGDVMGGDTENWHYVHVPDGDKATKLRLEAKLKTKGYVPCTDEERMVGFNSGQLFKIPRAIRREMMEDRHKRIQARKVHGASIAARLN